MASTRSSLPSPLPQPLQLRFLLVHLPPPPRHSLILHLLSLHNVTHTHTQKGREEKRESVPLFLPVTPPAFRLLPFPPKPSRDPTTSPRRGPRVETPSLPSSVSPPPPPPPLCPEEERRGECRERSVASAGLSLYPLSLISRRHRGPDPDGGGGLTLIGSEATSRRLRGTDRRTLSKNRAAELDGRFPKGRERETLLVLLLLQEERGETGEIARRWTTRWPGAGLLIFWVDRWNGSVFRNIGWGLDKG